MKGISLYIHIPFCKKRCHYCDFVTSADKDHLIGDYTEALMDDIKRNHGNKKFSTIFIGGGTPTHIDDESFEKLLKVIANLEKDENYEFTVEANPESLSGRKAELMKKYGVNRVSIGLQSTDNLLLKNIGRIHNYEDFLKAYSMVRKYIENVSFDLITALPGQTKDNLKETVKKAIEFNPNHISTYSLILEEGTPLFKRVKKGEVTLPTEDEDREFQDYIRESLEKNGYHRYEISNYSKEGYESRHNITYWEQRDYAASGVAASGFEKGIRYTNTSSIENYIKGIKNKAEIREYKEKVSFKDLKEEFIFMGMRMIRGIDMLEFKRRFNEDFMDKYADIVNKYAKTGHLSLEGNHLKFTNIGFDISNYILSDFME